MHEHMQYVIQAFRVCIDVCNIMEIWCVWVSVWLAGKGSQVTEDPCPGWRPLAALSQEWKELIQHAYRKTNPNKPPPTAIHPHTEWDAVSTLLDQDCNFFFKPWQSNCPVRSPPRSNIFHLSDFVPLYEDEWASYAAYLVAISYMCSHQRQEPISFHCNHNMRAIFGLASNQSQVYTWKQLFSFENFYTWGEGGGRPVRYCSHAVHMLS